MEELDLNLSLNEIKLLSKEAFKSKVKTVASKVDFKWLISEKNNLKKVKNIHYNKLELQTYLQIF